MKIFKTKKFKVIRIVLIAIFILYLILLISRIDISKGIITQIDSNKNTIYVNIEENPYAFSAIDILILNKNNKRISLNTLKINDNIFILSYNWIGWIYQPVAHIPTLIHNVWLLKVLD